MELKKLSIEQQLWEASRREIDVNQKLPADAENSQEEKHAHYCIHLFNYFFIYYYISEMR